MKLLNKASFLILLFSFLIFSGCEQKHDMQLMQSKVDAINAEMTKLIMENNSEGWLKLYTEDAISLPSYQPMLKGIDALREESEKQKDSPTSMKDFNIVSTDLWASGKFVIDIGTYNMTMDWPEAPGGEWSDQGKYMTLYEIQPDGSLLIKADTWNTDNNPWEQMASGQEDKVE
jgi:ketosteroid isomerase-like protein